MLTAWQELTTTEYTGDILPSYTCVCTLNLALESKWGNLEKAREREREKSKMVYRQDRETKEGDSVID